MFTITTSVDCFLLPDDGDAARALFLHHLEDPYEMWIIAYSFTLVPMIDAIITNSQSGPPIHIYLDRSQSKGSAEAPQIKRLVDAGVEVTIGTSPAGTSYITHTKGIVCDDPPQPWCWEGSVNFSQSGWMQVNTALFFHSQIWRDQFVKQFDALRDFAWTNLRADQLMSAPPKGVTIGKATAMPGPGAPAAIAKAGTRKRTTTTRKTAAAAKTTAKKKTAKKKTAAKK